MVQAGELTRRVRILNPIDAHDARGSSAGEYRDNGKIWAKIAPAGADEILIGDQLTGMASHKVTVYFTDRVTNRTVLELDDGRRLQIVGLVNQGELDRYLELRCRELVP